jgi:hypothetical protein
MKRKTIYMGEEIEIPEPGTHVLVNYNDELGYEERVYAVEYAEDIGNWIFAFSKKSDAEKFCKLCQFSYDPEKDFRDTCNKSWENL